MSGTTGASNGRTGGRMGASSRLRTSLAAAPRVRLVNPSPQVPLMPRLPLASSGAGPSTSGTPGLHGQNQLQAIALATAQQTALMVVNATFPETHSHALGCYYTNNGSQQKV